MNEPIQYHEVEAVRSIRFDRVEDVPHTLYEVTVKVKTSRAGSEVLTVKLLAVLSTDADGEPRCSQYERELNPHVDHEVGGVITSLVSSAAMTRGLPFPPPLSAEGPRARKKDE